ATYCFLLACTTSPGCSPLDICQILHWTGKRIARLGHDDGGAGWLVVSEAALGSTGSYSVQVGKCRWQAAIRLWFRLPKVQYGRRKVIWILQIPMAAGNRPLSTLSAFADFFLQISVWPLSKDVA